MADAAKRRKEKNKTRNHLGLIGDTSQLTILIWLGPHVFPAVFT